jgi:hypothetical protein
MSGDRPFPLLSTWIAGHATMAHAELGQIDATAAADGSVENLAELITPPGLCRNETPVPGYPYHYGMPARHTKPDCGGPTPLPVKAETITDTSDLEGVYPQQSPPTPADDITKKGARSGGQAPLKGLTCAGEGEIRRHADGQGD